MDDLDRLFDGLDRELDSELDGLLDDVGGGAAGPEPESWHTRQERDLIEERGGTWMQQPGVDGELHGRPVEVRATRRDDRYRIQRDVHRELVDERGNYIFHDDELGTRVVPATEVSDMLGRGSWFEDRSYPHRFVTHDDVF